MEIVRTKRELLGWLFNDEGEVVRVHKAGRSFWMTHEGREHLCHPSVSGVEGARREALLVFHVAVPTFERAA